MKLENFVNFFITVPSPVQDLNYNIINENTVCIHWREPLKKNGILKSYILSYTPNNDWPLENWLNMSIPPYQEKVMKCWKDENDLRRTQPDTMSIVLGNLTSDIQYMLLVRAVSQVGIGDPTFPIIINTKVLRPLDQASSVNKEKVGK